MTNEGRVTIVKYDFKLDSGDQNDGTVYLPSEESFDIPIIIYSHGWGSDRNLYLTTKVLKDKKLVVFAVGASPFDEKAMNALKLHNFKNEIASIPCFYCRGAWNEDAMTFKDKTLCNMLKMAVSKKDPSTYEPWEGALMEAIGSNFDWTDKGNLMPILEYVRTL